MCSSYWITGQASFRHPWVDWDCCVHPWVYQTSSRHPWVDRDCCGYPCHSQVFSSYSRFDWDRCGHHCVSVSLVSDTPELTERCNHPCHSQVYSNHSWDDEYAVALLSSVKPVLVTSELAKSTAAIHVSQFTSRHSWVDPDCHGHPNGIQVLCRPGPLLPPLCPRGLHLTVCGLINIWSSPPPPPPSDVKEEGTCTSTYWPSFWSLNPYCRSRRTWVKRCLVWWSWSQSLYLQLQSHPVYLICLWKLCQRLFQLVMPRLQKLFCQSCLLWLFPPII